MKRIYIVRHGETNLNTNDDDNRIMKQSPNTELNETGKNQSKITAECLKKMNKKIDIIISSPTLRAKQTAEIIAKEIGFTDQIIYEPRLREIELNEKYRNLTRKQFKELRSTDPDVDYFFKFHEKKEQIKLPIEQNEFMINQETNPKLKIYENSQSITQRLSEFIETIKALQKFNIIIVTHGGVIKWLNKLLTKNIGYDNIMGKMIHKNTNCSVTYYISQGDEFYLVSAPSNLHLKPN